MCVYFSISLYHGYVDFDVVSMQACSLLLDHPSQYETGVTLYDRYNKYMIMQKGKKMLSFHCHDEIVQCGKELVENKKKEHSLDLGNHLMNNQQRGCFLAMI